MRAKDSKVARSVRKMKVSFGELVAAAYDIVGSGPRAAERVAELLAASVEPRVVFVRINR